MKELLKNWGRPAAAILLAALVLLGTALGLKDIGQKKAQQEHLWLLQTLLPDSKEFTLEPYAGEDPLIRSVHKGENGFVVQTEAQGYAGPITMLVGVSTEGKVTGLVVLKQRETFGLGGKALTDHVFLSQFLQTDEVQQVGEDVDALTGATVTSKTIAKSVGAAVGYVTGADVQSEATSWGG